MLLILGSTNTDLVIRGPRLPRPGETVLGGSFYQAAGGKGANQAVAAARAGGRVTFVSAVGDDPFGRAALEGFAREGIDARCVKVVPGAMCTHGDTFQVWPRSRDACAPAPSVAMPPAPGAPVKFSALIERVTALERRAIPPKPMPRPLNRSIE